MQMNERHDVDSTGTRPPSGSPVLSSAEVHAVPDAGSRASVRLRRFLLLLLFLSAGWVFWVVGGGTARADDLPMTPPVQGTVPTPATLASDPAIPLPTDGLPVPSVVGEAPPGTPAPVDPILVPVPPVDPVVTPPIPGVPDPGTDLPVEPDPEALPIDPGIVVPLVEEAPTDQVPPAESVAAEPATEDAVEEVVVELTTTEECAAASTPQVSPALLCDEPAPIVVTVPAAPSAEPATVVTATATVTATGAPASTPTPSPAPARPTAPLGSPATPDPPPDYPLPSPSPPPLAPAPAASTVSSGGGAPGAYGDPVTAMLPGDAVSPTAPTGTGTGGADADRAFRQSFQPGTRPD